MLLITGKIELKRADIISEAEFIEGPDNIISLYFLVALLVVPLSSLVGDKGNDVRCGSLYDSCRITRHARISREGSSHSVNDVGKRQEVILVPLPHLFLSLVFRFN